ncbi:MAG: phosphoribosyltransferase [bacterium]|nr:phosphoribosyltransferase [bacterium]
MTKPSRFVFLDDLSGHDPFLRTQTAKLANFVDSSQSVILANSEQLTQRLKDKYLSGLKEGIYPNLDLIVGVGSSGFELAEKLNLQVPIIKITPYRDKNSDGTDAILTRSGIPLITEIAESKHLLRVTKNQLSIGVVDDTVFSGVTLSEIYAVLRQNFKSLRVLTLTLTSVPIFLQNNLKDSDIQIISALEIRTNAERKGGLNSVDMKDLVLDDALPLGDGCSIPFMFEENWMRAWFGRNYNQAMIVCREIRHFLQNGF